MDSSEGLINEPLLVRVALQFISNFTMPFFFISSLAAVIGLSD